MRIVLFGHGSFGQNVLIQLLKQGMHVVGIVTDKHDSFAEIAAAAEIPVVSMTHSHDALFLSAYKELHPDLNVLLNLEKILSEDILYYPSHKTIAFHPSLLPEHRGKNALNWAIIKGKTKTGISIFWPDKGIDTGPLLLQKECPIYETDTASGLYRRSIFPIGVDAVLEAVQMVMNESAPRRPQEGRGSYESPLNDAYTHVDWQRDYKLGKEIYNLIRGCDRTPGAWTILRGKRVSLRGAIFCDAVGEPGSIIHSETGITLISSGGAVHVASIGELP